MSTRVFDCQDAFPSNTCACNFSSGKHANGSGKLNVSTRVFDCQDAFPSNTCTYNFSSGKHANGSGKLMEKADEKVWVVIR